jgi:GWxTD domain-containing protein
VLVRLALIIVVTLCSGRTDAQDDPVATARKILSEAEAADADAWRSAITSIEALTAEAPTEPHLYAFIAALHMKLEDGKSARAALEKATKLDATLTAAHFAIGRTYLELDENPEAAIPHFKTALDVDSTYAEALAQLALAYHQTGKKRDARSTADRAIKLDPRLAVPYRILAENYVETGNTTASLAYFKRYLDRNPADEHTARQFAGYLLDEERWEDLYEVTSRLNETESLPLLAISLINKGEHEGAMQAFQDYMASLEEEEAALYEDITFVGLKREVRAYRTVPETAKTAFLKQFWMRRDPFKTSGGAMRRAEHYRRVWHARQTFGEKKFPWDRRGEVYIRYGEPYWRSSSKDLNAIVPPEVQHVQDLMAARLYGSESVDHTFVGPVYPIRHQTDAGLSLSNPSVHSGELLGLQSYKPVTAGSDWSTIPWESWVYTDVGGGIEISFTDEFLSGNYNYAPIPTLTEDDMTRLELSQGSALAFIGRITEYAPAALVSRVASEEPERYDLALLEPLHFFYEALAYRGADGLTDLQINLALPIDNIAMDDDPDTNVVVERRVVLLRGTREVDRSVENLGVGINAMNRDQGLLAVERVNMAIQPGEYELRIQASRRNTNRVQVYGQALELIDFSKPDLALSDLQIAQHVSEADPAQPSKFTRNGWDIRPAPARTFRQGEPLFVYYEIYNLTKDSFGQTRYKISYEVQTRTQEGSIKIPFLAKLRKKEGEKIGFEFEQTGSNPMESDYFELDLAEAKPGRYELRMKISDVSSGEETSRTSLFSVTP